MRIIIPEKVKFIIDKIYEQGFEAFIVGGCVRDSIIGLEPHDYDITTNAKPDEIIKIFKEYKILDNGIKHGTVGVIIDKEVYEITTYRIESEYEDNRRPKNVEFTSDLIEDLKRRDFTINAMAYNDKVGLIDKFNGIDDLNNRIIRTVGNPDERFNEDGLRIIRAVRFSCKLDFSIEEETLKSIYKNADIINKISIERITDEFTKAILSNNPNNIILLFKSNIMAQLGIYNYLNEHDYKIIENNINILRESPNDLTERLIILEYLIINEKIKLINKEDEKILYYKTKIQDKNIVNMLRYPNKITNSCNLLLQVMILDEKKIDKVKLKRFMNKVGIDELIKILELKKIYYSYFILNGNSIDMKENVSILNSQIHTICKIKKDKECYSIKDLDIDGKVLGELGYKGKEIGEKLNYLLEKVLINPSLNSKKELIKILSVPKS